jgi:hypothetical protein
VAALAEFNEQAKLQKRPIEAGKVVDGLGALMKNWRTQALSTQTLLIIFFENSVLTLRVTCVRSLFSEQPDTTVTPLDTTRASTPASAPISFQ